MEQIIGPLGPDGHIETKYLDEIPPVAAGLPESCSGCPLSTNRSCGKFTQVEGKGRLGVLLVGEASGKQEAAAGLPFRPKAPAGSVLERAIKGMNLERETDVWVTNIVRCHPPNDFLLNAPWEKDAIEHCRANLDQVVDQLKPRAIVALGAIPMRELTGLSGEKLNVPYLRGYVLPSRYGIPVIPTFHPSYLGRETMKYLGILMRDIARAVTVAQKRIEPCIDLASEVECRTGIEDLREIYERAKADPSLPIAVDCETNESAEGDEDEVVEFSRDLERAWEAGKDGEGGEEDNGEMGEGTESIGDSYERGDSKSDRVDPARSRVKTIQFAIERSWGVSVPWTEGYKELALEVLRLSNPKIWHNGDLFDEPVLEKAGAVVAGEKDDTLVMQKNLQPELPAHLQAVSLVYRPGLGPWKHLAGTNLELYGAIDAAVLLDVYAGLERDMKRIKGPNGVTVWDGYVKWTKPLRPVLNDVTGRGVPMDVPMLDALRGWLGEELGVIDGELQGLIPDELRRGKLEEGCKKVPDDVKEWLMRERSDLWAPTVKTYKNGKTKEIASKVKISEVYEWLMSETDGWTQTLSKLCTELGYVVRSYQSSREENSSTTTPAERRLVKLKPFNPGSPLQMLNYIRFKKYAIPTRFKDGKPTTADKELEKLWRRTKDPVLKLSRDRRATAKLRDSYTGKIGEDGVARGGWIPGPDGRLRSTIKLTSATWQLRAVNPNILTLPKKRKVLAEKFRSCVRAEPGHVMIEFDYSAFHALMTARESRDPVLHRVSQMDPHAFVAGHFKKHPGIETCLSMSDADLREYLIEIRAKHGAVREFQAKPFVHGFNFGEGPYRIYHENSEHFRDLAEAKRLHGQMKRIFPGVAAWQEKIVEQADDAGKLVSVWGAVRWFWDAKKWEWTDRGWKRGKGSQAEAAMAFLPANHSHGMLRMKLIRMQEWEWNERYGLVNIPHDAIWLHCRKELEDECIEKVGDWLRTAVLELADPVMCPKGFVCNVEAKIGASLAESEMEKIKI